MVASNYNLSCSSCKCFETLLYACGCTTIHNSSYCTYVHWPHDNILIVWEWLRQMPQKTPEVRTILESDLIAYATIFAQTPCECQCFLQFWCMSLIICGVRLHTFTYHHMDAIPLWVNLLTKGNTISLLAGLASRNNLENN